MKRRYSLLVSIVLITTLFITDVFAQDYTKLHLPPGAKARLGKGWINDIKFSPDGDQLAVATTIGVWIYDVRTGKEAHFITDIYTNGPELVNESMGGANAISYSPDGTILAAAHWDRKIRLWDVSKYNSNSISNAIVPELLSTFEGHTGPVYDVAFSSDGNMVASGSADKSIRIWNPHATTADEKLIAILPYKDSVYTVAFSPDSHLLAGGSGNGIIQVWDAGTGDRIYEFDGHKDSVWAVDFSPDRTSLASASLDGSVQLWNVVAEGGKLHAPTEHNAPVYAVKFSPDGKSFATGSANKLIQLWNTNTTEHNFTLTGHKDLVSDVDFSPDGSTIASGSPDGTIRLWDRIGARRRIEISGHTGGIKALVYTEDNRIRACGTGLDNKLRLWDAGTSSELSILQEHTGLTQAVAFSKDGKTFASGGNEDGTIFLSDVTIALESDEGLGDDILLSMFTGNTHGITALALSPADTTLASGGKDGRIYLLDVKTQRRLKTLNGPQSTVTALTFVYDGTLLCSGEENGTFRLWNALSGNVKFVSEPEFDHITALAFTPDARFLGIGNKTGKIWLYDLVEKQKRIIKTRHTRKITALVFAKDGSTLVSGSEDGTVLLWNVNESTFNMETQEAEPRQNQPTTEIATEQQSGITQTPQQIAKSALASTVLLSMQDANGNQQGYGSGFFVGPGQIATNYHVIKGAARKYVRVVGGEKWHAVESVIATDAEHDLAILKINGINLTVLPLANSDKVEIGEEVYAVGNPKGWEGTVSNGIVSSIRGEGNNKWIQITAAISPGSSGGAVLNTKGEVIGIATLADFSIDPNSKINRVQNLNFAVPSNYLKALLRKGQ